MNERHKVVLDPDSEQGYRLEAVPDAEPTLTDFQRMDYSERVALHNRDQALYRRLADAEWAETFSAYGGRR